MFFLRNMIFLLLVYFTSSTALWAVEFNVQAEKALWRYQEYAKDVTGFSAILPSQAQGDGALVKLRLSSERDQDWFYAISGSLMNSTASTQEVWGMTQTNQLTIKQQDARIDIQRRFLGARFGLWLSTRQQKQERKYFVVNHVATPLTNEPILEKISSNWIGLSLTSVGGNVGQFEARIDAGLALKVKVTNPLFSNPFSKKDGFRTGVHFRWTLPKQEVGVSGLNITLNYEYQELGGENTMNNGFWPYNRWQVASVGLMYAW